MLQHNVEQATMLKRVESRGGPRLPWKVDLADGRASLGPAIVSFYHLANGGFSLAYYRRSDHHHPDVDADRETIEDAVFCIAATYKRFGERASALQVFADDVRSRSSVFGVSGPHQLNRSERLERQRQIESQADRIVDLADASNLWKATTYQDFNAILKQLTGLGYSPPDPSLVTAIAQTYVERSRAVRLIFVRSGHHDEPVTKTVTINQAKLEKRIEHHKLRHLGMKLPIFGESRRQASFAGPDHVVIDAREGSDIRGINKPGYYLIEGLRPAEIQLT